MQQKKEPPYKPKEWLLIDEVRAYIKEKTGRTWSRVHIYALMKLKKINYYQYGTQRIFLMHDIDAYIKEKYTKIPTIKERIVHYGIE